MVHNPIASVMSILALTLLLSSAVLHALWNLLLKRSEEKFIAMGWQVIIGSLATIPVLYFTGLPPRSIWLFVIISTILEAIYFGLLTSAYNDHDFSLIYPVARGAAPALVVIWSALFLDEIPSVGGFVGIVMIIGGLIIIGITSSSQHQAGKPHLRGILMALSVALVISIYTLVDGYAVKHSPALPYGLGLFFLMPIFTTPLIVRHYGWQPMLATFRAQVWRLVLVGVLALVAYLSALSAYSIAPVNYSEAIREVSVVLGAFMGWYFLGEQMGKFRTLGALVIFGGIVLITIFG
jgi:drug/metabolite transporter (DMT)-like permease